MKPSNKVAIVTGASRGIGRGIAVHLAKKGFDVVVCSRTVKEGQSVGTRGPLPGSLEGTAAEVRALGRKTLVVKLDLLEKRDGDNVVQETMDEFGRIDVLVNNAAKFGREGTGLLLDTPIEEFERDFFANILMPLHFTKLVAPIMKQQGGGMVVNISSEAARWDAGGVMVGYAVSKAGLGRQASVLARELKQYKIAVVNVEPGLVDNGHLADDIKGFGLPVDVPGATVAYLASHPHPLFFSGKVVDAPTFAVEHNLVDPGTMPAPYGPSHWGLPVRSPRPLNPRPGN